MINGKYAEFTGTDFFSSGILQILPHHHMCILMQNDSLLQAALSLAAPLTGTPRYYRVSIFLDLELILYRKIVIILFFFLLCLLE